MTDVIAGILSEKDVLQIPNEVLIDFASLLNTDMLTGIKGYVKTSSNMEVVNKLKETILSQVEANTLHVEIKENDVTKFLGENRIYGLADLAYNGDVDIDKLVDTLKWLKSNEGSIQATLPARDKDVYESVVKRVGEIQTNYNLQRLMVNYKQVLFCPTRDKETSTGLKNMVRKKADWEMQYKAALYLQHCLRNGIARSAARIVN